MLHLNVKIGGKALNFNSVSLMKSKLKRKKAQEKN